MFINKVPKEGIGMAQFYNPFLFKSREKKQPLLCFLILIQSCILLCNAV